MTDERKCEHGYGIKQGPCPTCDSADDIRNEWPMTCDCPCGDCCASLRFEAHCRSKRCIEGMSARVT